MSNDNVIKLIQRDLHRPFDRDLAQWGVRLVDPAVEAEVAEFLTKHADLKTGDGHRRVVRHGRLPRS